MAIQRASHHRWRDVILYSVFGALAAVPLSFAVDAALDGLLSRTPVPLLRGFVSGGIGLVLLGLLGIQSRTRLAHFRTLNRYPSTLVAVPIALWLLAVFLAPQQFEGWDAAATSHLCGSIFFLAGSSTLAVLIAWWIANRRNTKFPTPIGQSADLDALLSMPFEQLEQWLSSEESIAETGDDYFGAGDLARRISDVLKTPRANQNGKDFRQTVVLQGSFGAGKSSVMQLVKHFIRESSGEQFIFVDVKCWGFSSIAAQEHVLEKAVDGLSEHVDCLALRQLPAAYVEAISGAGSWLGGVIRAVGGSGTPTGQLKRFTPVLRAINAQLVIVVEDTDRNGPDFDQKHIEAMLHNFRDVERVSFVLTAGRDSNIDFAKIAEHILFMPVPPEEKILAILDRVRTHCQSGPWIDPSPSEIENSRQGRPASLRATASSAREVSRQMGFGDEIWPLSVATLLETPRKLKRTLNAVIERWGNLRGEVDLDELIMVTALRHAAPAVFSFLGSNFHEFQVLAQRKEGELPEKLTRRERRVRDLKRRWLKANREAGGDPFVIGQLMAELFPWSANITGIESQKDGGRRQSIDGPRGNLYWQRLTAETLSDEEVHDQTVLTALHEATTDEGIARLGKLGAESNDFARLVAFFNKPQRIESEALLQATSIALQFLRPFQTDWRYPGSASYRAVMDWLNTIELNAETLEDWFAKEMFACLPSHLADAAALHFEMKHTHLGQNSCRAVRQRFIQRLKETFENKIAAHFVAGFDEKFPFTLMYLIRPGVGHEKPFLSESEDDWKWLVPFLLDGMEQAPQMMVPQVMLLFGVYGPGGETPSYFTYNESEMGAFFGVELPRAIALLARPFAPPKDLEGFFLVGGLLGTKKAAEWLERLQTESESASPG